MSGSKVKAQFDTDHVAPSNTSMPMTPVATEPDPEFYFDDNLVVIQIESTLFRVHRFQLAKSETFLDMLNVPKRPTKGPEEGTSSDERPIVLRGVKASDFKALLKVLYAFKFSNEKFKPEIIVPAFRLAHMWNFTELRNHLFPLAKDALGCVDKIVLGKELGVQEWLAPAYVELCQRTESLTVEEGTRLGIHGTIMITRSREQFRPFAGDYCWQCAGVSLADYTPTSCRGCSMNLTSAYRYTTGPRCKGPPPKNDALEAQVKKWIEEGCVTE